MVVPPFYPLTTTPEERDAVSEVLPKTLFLTNWRGAEDKSKLAAMGVTHVAAVGTEFLDDDEVFVYWKQDIGDEDDEQRNMSTSMLEGAAFIHKAVLGGGMVVVHCAAGMSRSVTVVLAYLLLYTGKTLRESFAIVHAARPGIWPNDGFMAALIAQEASARGTETINMDEYVSWGDYEATEEDHLPAMPLPRLLRVETKVTPEERAEYRMASGINLLKLGSSSSVVSDESSTMVGTRTDRRGSVNREELKALKTEAERSAMEARASAGRSGSSGSSK